MLANNLFSFFFRKAITPSTIEIGTLIGTEYTVSFKTPGSTLKQKEIVITKDKVPNPKDV
ncbi:hypothetical protein GCM10007063_30680 [Lentibacillus kapialis]|uniref:Uncharacterized protein n=1 Tax=Lentibacillus kapialis TaxID=340214 RepID=A0A917Q1K8_9BACI|nr:hypothetical protein GCM10007063_30680 [Lentibacillus kapialis]